MGGLESGSIKHHVHHIPGRHGSPSPGLPLLSGFFSKDFILAHAYQYSPVVFALLLGGALLTTFYMFRLLLPRVPWNATEGRRTSA
jgi:NADH:ubiquinone oxidoreductase subunit 5 (subunit L)/multisubunit Na+/H+ antiporter MnhA subunit